MIISSIMKRYYNTYESPLNIISTPCDNKKFFNFLQKILPNDSRILSLEDTLFGNISPDIIICHNKINYLDKCGHMSYFLHCPILVIDHEPKPSFIDKNIISYQSNSIYTIALTNEIYNSWGQTHNLVLNFNPDKKDNTEQWHNLLYQVTKIPFNLKPKEHQKYGEK